MVATADIDEQLALDLAGYQHDPLGFVLAAFDWGVGELAGKAGPRLWQREVLAEVGERLRAGADLGAAMQPVLEAVASGHGIGKSALVTWFILWALSTREDTKIVVTADTAGQLATKTWPELAKWHRLAINAHWFVYTATSIYSADDKHAKTWRADAIPWSEHHTEAFAGLHNEGKRLVLIFDEASGIADKVWEVSEGALTDEGTEILWLAFGNPTRNTGRFRECFGRFAHRWQHRQIDSRTVEGTNKEQLAKWVEDFGEDSDFVRVRVRGQFPNAGSMQFIPSNVVADAAAREPHQEMTDPVVVGVDVARFGDDESVICIRVGRDARTYPLQRFRGLDTMQLAARVAAVLEKHGAHACFVDETGVGGGVVDRLRDLGHRVTGVNNGAKADRTAIDGESVANKGAECWSMLRSWLKTGGAIDDDADLRSQLESREYGYNQHNEIVLEPKDVMKKRGLASPDLADAIALTFAYPVAARGQSRRTAGQVAAPDWNPYEDR